MITVFRNGEIVKAEEKDLGMVMEMAGEMEMVMEMAGEMVMEIVVIVLAGVNDNH